MTLQIRRLMKITGFYCRICGVICDEVDILNHEDEICEECFSSPTYSVLKTKDEKFVVEKMFSNPKFVEDLTRECFEKVKETDLKGTIEIKAISYESIHKHNVIAEITREINGGL